MLRPSDHPSFSRLPRKAVSHDCISGSSSATPINTPTRRIGPPCCARAVTGHAAAPLRSAMNSRRRIRSPNPSAPVCRITYWPEGCIREDHTRASHRGSGSGQGQPLRDRFRRVGFSSISGPAGPVRRCFRGGPRAVICAAANQLLDLKRLYRPWPSKVGFSPIRQSGHKFRR
jgi:hypothetical protein